MSIQNIKKAGTSINNVVWISHIYTMKSKFKRVSLTAFSAIFEEVLFRGIFFSLILTSLNNNIIASIVIVTVLFVLQQSIMLSTKDQILIIGSSSALLSIFGCLLFILSGTIIYSCILHALFAGFYVGDNE